MKGVKAADILALSHDMLALVTVEDWEAFSELQMQQMQLMVVFFEGLDGELLASERDALEQVQVLNAELIRLAETHKAALGQELRTLKQNTEKAKAYQR